jgi:endo-1,4-beta-xylanase
MPEPRPRPKSAMRFSLIDVDGPIAMPTGEWKPEGSGGAMSRGSGMGVLSTALLAAVVLPGCTPTPVSADVTPAILTPTSPDVTLTPQAIKTELPNTSITFEMNDLTSAYKTSTDANIQALIKQLESKYGAFQDSWALSAFANGNPQAVDTIQFFNLDKAHMVGFWTKDAQDKPLMQNPGPVTRRYMYDKTSGELTYELMTNGTDATVSQSFLKMSTISDKVTDLSALATSANSGDVAAQAQLDQILGASKGNFILSLSNLATGRTDVGTLSSDQMTAVPPTAAPDDQRSILDKIMEIGVTPVSALELPLEEQSLTQTVIGDFVWATNKAGIATTPEQLKAQKLQIKTMIGVDGKTYEVATVHLDPDPKKTGEQFEGDYPLMIRAEGGEWSRATIKQFANGWNIGTNLSTPYYSKGLMSSTDKLVVDHFNFAMLSSIDWWNIEKNEGVFTFEKADAAVALAQQNGMAIEGDNLVFPGAVDSVPYLKAIEDDQTLTPQQKRDKLITIMNNHIVQVMTHYKDSIHQWPVTLEYRQDPNYDKFRKIIGPDYVDIAFATARKTDPTALLFYNDSFNNTKNEWNYSHTLEIVQRLKKAGNIDAVGMEMHLDGSKPPTKQELVAAMKGYGIRVIVSSFDINMKDVPGTPEERERKYAEILRTALQAAIESGVCTDFSFWEGVGDKNNWLERMEMPGLSSPDADPTIFHDDLSPKLAYYEFLRVLFEQSQKK